MKRSIDDWRMACVALLAAASPAIALADSGCTAGSEFEPPLCPTGLPKALRVSIDRNTSPDCSRFIVTPAVVRQYLASAKRVPEGSGHSTLDWSPCHAGGTVRFADGQSAHWSVMQTGVGSLSFDGQPAMTLYCPTCTTRPFSP